MVLVSVHRETDDVSLRGRLTMADEKRLVYADDLRKEIESLSMTVTGLRAGKGVLAEFMRQYRDSVLRIIDEQPTVEAEPVRRGSWISWEEADNFIPSPDRHECSACHDAAYVLVNRIELLSDYCPDCGARMD